MAAPNDAVTYGTDQHQNPSETVLRLSSPERVAAIPS